MQLRAQDQTEAGWSPGTTGPSSTRFATEDPNFSSWGVQEIQSPFCGKKFFKKFNFTEDKLSVSDKLTTDVEWSVARASAIIIKGTVDLDTVQEALAAEGIFPVQCIVKGEDKPKALASIWINELHDSVCGAYHEIVISFDVHKTKQDLIAFKPSCASPAAYQCWYNFFDDSVCEAQFFHSLYINSPLSISWGREMQAFPRHPVPVLSKVDVISQQKTCQVKWDEDMVLNVSLKKRFGVIGFLREGFGLLFKVGLFRVLRFLGSSTFRSHIIMPKTTALKYERPLDYTAHAWKGLHPTAAQIWPWNAKTDTLELGDIIKDTGCEQNNGAALLKKACFEPLSVVYLESFSGIVVTRDT